MEAWRASIVSGPVWRPARHSTNIRQEEFPGCLAGAHSEFFEPPHRYERLLMVLRRSIHLTLAHGNAWSARRSECLEITKVGRLIIRCVEEHDIGVILFPE